ncbi:MAG: hypothetical protein MUP99_06740 [Pedobacter sp.]|nr:hypothetical protein [Pedobacter sp.]
MKKFTFCLKMGAYAMLCIGFLSFSFPDPLEEDAGYVQQQLSAHCNALSGTLQIKKYELNVTKTGFCRYKRFLQNGKVEYFSFNLIKFKHMDYLGNSQNGILYLRTKGDDVIVQTYNDSRGGDIDSMSTYLSIPLKSIEPEDLNEFAQRFQRMSLALRR